MRLVAHACAMTTVIALSSLLQAQFPATGATIGGKIDSIVLDDANDVWSGGKIVVAGQQVIIPRNLLIDLPANRLSLQQLLTEAPARSRSVGEFGLAADESTGYGGAFAHILANRNAHGNVIAGDVFIEKGQELITGKVTFIEHTDGYFRVDGIANDPNTGVMVRINDPESRHTIQQGLGAGTEGNGSPDARFGLDPDNYTITFTTGYPCGIPSTVPVGQRAGFVPGSDNAGAASDAQGQGDPFCPTNNRGAVTAADSRRFAPLLVGDTVQAEGNWEDFGGVRYISAHSMTVFNAIQTRNAPNQPDYLIWDEVEWDLPGFQNSRCRVLMIGFSTDPTSQVDVFSLYVDPTTGDNHEFIMASTVNNPDTINQGVGGGAGGIFKIKFNLDFLEAASNDINPDSSPGQNLTNAGFGSRLPNGPASYEDNFAILSPISRELIGRSRHKLILTPGTITRDINGNEAPNGEYLTPVGMGHPEFVEINLDVLTTPFIFEGIPWNLDRRLSPGGFDGATTPQPLDPFPVSGLNPVGQEPLLPSNAAARVPAFYPFNTASRLSMVPIPPSPIPITQARLARASSLAPVSLQAGTFERFDRGNGNANVFVAAPAGHALQATTGSGLSRLMTEQAPGRFYVQIPFASLQFSTGVTIQDMTNRNLASVVAQLADIVNVKSASYSTATHLLSVVATSSDVFSQPTLQVFGDDGVLLGTLVRGVLSLTVAAAPSSVTVRSSRGGSDSSPTTITGRSR